MSDITYVPTQAGWLYLAVVLDLASRRVVGWAMGERIDVALQPATREMALADRRPAPGLWHHSDRGSVGGLRGIRRGVARVELLAYNAWLHRKLLAIVDVSGCQGRTWGGVTPSAVRGRLLGRCGEIVWVGV